MTSLVRAGRLSLPGRLAEVDLDFDDGSVTAVVGPNGSGKTSLLLALASVQSAAGHVSVAGTMLRGLHPGRRQSLVGLLTAERYVAWPLSGRVLLSLGLTGSAGQEEVVEALALSSLLDRRVDRLSSGERARLLLGRLLISDPKLLLLDEPLANLDPYWQLQVMDLLRKRSGKRGGAIVLALHDMPAAARWADRLLLMEHGAIIWDGPAKDLQATGEADRVFGAHWTGADWVSFSEDPQSLR